MSEWSSWANTLSFFCGNGGEPGSLVEDLGMFMGLVGIGLPFLTAFAAFLKGSAGWIATRGFEGKMLFGVLRFWKGGLVGEEMGCPGDMVGLDAMKATLDGTQMGRGFE